MSQEHILNDFQKARREKVMEICQKLQLMSVRIENTRTQALKLLKHLEKGFEFNGKTPIGIACSIVYERLPMNTKTQLPVEEYANLFNVSESTIRERILEIKRFMGEIR